MHMYISIWCVYMLCVWGGVTCVDMAQVCDKVRDPLDSLDTRLWQTSLKVFWEAALLPEKPSNLGLQAFAWLRTEHRRGRGGDSLLGVFATFVV